MKSCHTFLLQQQIANSTLGKNSEFVFGGVRIKQELKNYGPPGANAKPAIKTDRQLKIDEILQPQTLIISLTKIGLGYQNNLLLNCCRVDQECGMQFHLSISLHIVNFLIILFVRSSNWNVFILKSNNILVAAASKSSLFFPKCNDHHKIEVWP